MAKTRHGQKGIGVRPYAGFVPKNPASGPKSSATVTRLLSIGIGGRRRKTGKGEGPFTRLTTMAINGRRVVFEPKNPIIPPVELVVTRLLTFGIGGKRVSFEPKTPFETASTNVMGGGKKIYGVKKKQWTDEEIKGLEAYGKASLRIVDEPEEISTPSTEELVILERQEEPELAVSIDSQVGLDSIESPDMGLILAIWEAHNS